MYKKDYNILNQDKNDKIDIIIYYLYKNDKLSEEIICLTIWMRINYFILFFSEIILTLILFVLKSKLLFFTFYKNYFRYCMKDQSDRICIAVNLEDRKNSQYFKTKIFQNFPKSIMKML
jgi:hypothetical protein